MEPIEIVGIDLNSALVGALAWVALEGARMIVKVLWAAAEVAESYFGLKSYEIDVKIQDGEQPIDEQPIEK